MGIQWDKMRDALLPIIALNGLLAVGLSCIFLAVNHPEMEWLKEIAFFLFGSGTGPLYNVVMYATKGIKPSGMITKLFIGGVIGLALSQVACVSTGLQAPNTTVNVTYENGQTCMEIKSCVERKLYDSYMDTVGGCVSSKSETTPTEKDN